MKIGIISDIHSNFEALEEALSVLDASHTQKLFCCGDVVGYGPDPSECVSLVRKRGIFSVLGNHDYAVGTNGYEKLFNEYARIAITWTRDRLSEADRNHLLNFPLFFETEELTFFHGMYSKANPFRYTISDYDAWLSLKELKTNISFFGHSHIAGVYEMDQSGKVRFLSARKGLKIYLEENKRYIINPGSIGQPRDNNPDGALAIFDTKEKFLEIKRFAYDVEKTYKKIMKAGLPAFLGERLFIGV